VTDLSRDAVLAILAQRARQHLTALDELLKELRDSFDSAQQWELEAAIRYIGTTINCLSGGNEAAAGERSRLVGEDEPRSSTPTMPAERSALLDRKPLRKLALVARVHPICGRQTDEEYAAAHGLPELDPNDGAA
jgi:hypothetical protein